MILENYQLQAAENKSSLWQFGLRTECIPLSDEQIGQLYSLFEDARPEWTLPSEIYDMVCEELTP